MQELTSFQVNVIKNIDNQFIRSLYNKLPWNQRMLAIKGLRGAGKTTLLLQYLKYGLNDPQHSLYVTADHPWFYTHTLLELADEFYLNGGKHLFIDEVHKYKNWSQELKNIYDGYPDLKVVFTASSALDIYRSEADLSRRVLTYDLPGMSFREYLELVHKIKLPTISLEDLLQQHVEAAYTILKTVDKPIPLFKQYLKNGYLPFTVVERELDYLSKLYNVINTTLSYDLAFIENYSASHVEKLKKLLGVLAESAPFEPNISAIARKLTLGRDTVNAFLQNLQTARMVNLLSKATHGVAALQKPDKIYLENTNFSYALKPSPEAGTIRETFMFNQLRNAGHIVHQASKGDFLVDEKITFEIGGKGKSTAQIRDTNNAYIAADDIEAGALNRIPLWLFGFLY
jgi:predicted AAA+ superfamily ATPase